MPVEIPMISHMTYPLFCTVMPPKKKSKTDTSTIRRTRAKSKDSTTNNKKTPNGMKSQTFITVSPKNGTKPMVFTDMEKAVEYVNTTGEEYDLQEFDTLKQAVDATKVISKGETSWLYSLISSICN